MGYQNIVVNPEAFTGIQYSSYQPVVSPINVLPSKTKRTENIDFQAYSKYDILTEGFDNHGYVSGKVDDISNNKVGPLKQVYNDLSISEVKMANQSGDLGNDIKAYQNLRTHLQNDHQYDFNGNQFSHNKRQQTLQDGLQEDANALIIQQNNLYILGTITVSFMIVGAIMLTR